VPAQTVLPRWRGFNLPSPTLARPESDFRIVAELGFDFVRIPTSYRDWTDPVDRFAISEEKVAVLDEVVRHGERHGLHVNFAFHRGPGYCCSPGDEPGGGEPWSLWKSEEALRAFCHHWTFFARRWRSIPSSRLSFNLLNESPPPVETLPHPPAHPLKDMSRADHERVMRAAVAAIRAVDPGRLIIVDGMWYGRGEPTWELADLGVAQSTRAYVPMTLSHWKAPWTSEGRLDLPEPAWPGVRDPDGAAWSRQTLEAHYARWADLARKGIGVHCGEGGCYIHTAHAVFLRWFENVLDILTSHGIGFALWELRGPFGILDSGRRDVAYEDWRGRALDRKLLALLQRH
jgi:endoglucanase